MRTERECVESSAWESQLAHHVSDRTHTHSPETAAYSGLATRFGRFLDCGARSARLISFQSFDLRSIQVAATFSVPTTSLERAIMRDSPEGMCVVSVGAEVPSRPRVFTTGTAFSPEDRRSRVCLARRMRRNERLPSRGLKSKVS